MKSEDKKNNWTKILIDAGMIVLSVLLALFINEWKSQYNSRLETEKMLHNIVLEIKKNQAFNQENIAYHRTVIGRIQEVAMADSLSQVFFKEGLFYLYDVAPKGIMQGDLSNIAWMVAQESKISNRIPFGHAQKIFSVYKLQLKVRATADRVIEILSSREIHRESLLEESIILFATELNELASQEEQLDYEYAKALKTIRKNTD